jgi:hypothetical protein
LRHGRNGLPKIFGTKQHMDICTLLFLEFLFGSTKDWLNSSKSRSRQMGFIGDTQTI